MNKEIEQTIQDIEMLIRMKSNSYTDSLFQALRVHIINQEEIIKILKTQLGESVKNEEFRTKLSYNQQSKLDKINHYNRTQLCYGIVYDKIKQILGER